MSKLLASGWTYLAIAIVFEVAATWFLKLSNNYEGMQQYSRAGLAILLYGVCFLFMLPAYKALPAGVVYAVWSGLGIVAITALGIIYFGERLEPTQFTFIAFIFIGAVGLSISTNSAPH